MATTGHCLCREVTFAFEGEPKWTLYCHCESCRRATSTPVAVWISVPTEKLRFTQGAPTYFASSAGVRRGFCGRCGSPLTYENEKLPGEVHLLSGTLGDPNAVNPSAHIFVAEQLDWFDAADGLPRYEQTRRNAEPIRRGPRK